MSNLNVGNPVTGKNFIGRENEIEHITEVLSQGQNVVLIAPRRYGKTSLILQLLSQIQNTETYSAFIDLFPIPSIEMLPSQITEAVLKNHELDQIFTKTKNSAISMIQNEKLKPVIKDFEFLLSFSVHQENNWELLGNSIDFIDQFAKKHNKRMVCTFDEFGDISKFDGNKTAKLIRSKFQQHTNTSYIFSGSYESVMSNLFIEKKSPFYGFAQIINLAEIENEKFLAFYISQLKKHQIYCELNFLNKVLRFTNGHPYYSQLALQEIIIFKALYKKIPSYNELLGQMLNTEKSYLEKTWEELSAKKETTKALLAVVQSNKQIYTSLKNSGINIYRALKTLTLNGILLKTKKGYRLSDPLFKHWIEQNILNIL